MAMCDLCGMAFNTQAKLDTHRNKFCQGSVLHRQVLAQRKEARGAIAGSLDEDAVNALSKGLSALSDDVIGLSVSELRAKIAREAAERTEERRAREEAAERAALRLKEQRAKAEVHQQMLEAQLAAHRTVELQARVQLRAAERFAEAAELKFRQRQQHKELAELQRQQEDLAAARARLADEALGVQAALAELQSGTVAASKAMLEARTQVAAANLQRLSPEAEAERQALMLENAERRRQSDLEHVRLRRQQQAFEQTRREQLLAYDEAQAGTAARRDHADDVSGTGGANGARGDGGGGGPGSPTRGGGGAQSLAMRQLRAQQADDERRLAELRSQLELHGVLTEGIEARALHAPPLATTARAPAGVAPPSPTPSAPTSIIAPPSPPPPPRTVALGAAERAEAARLEPTLEADLVELRAAYAAAGGQNPQLLHKLEQLQRDVTRLAPVTGVASEAHSTAACGAPPVAPSAAGFFGAPPPLWAPPPPAAPLSYAPPYYAAAAAMDGPLAVQLAALQRAVEAREAHARQLEAAVTGLRHASAVSLPPAPPDALSELLSSQQHANGRLRPSTREREEDAFARRQIKYESELAKLRHEREMIEERERLRSAKEAAATRAKEAEESSKHDEWMREQKRALVEARVQRELLRNGPTSLGPTSLPSSTLPGVPYEEAAGMCAFFDFVTGLPWVASQCLLAYTLYNGVEPLGAVKTLPAVECEAMAGGFTRSLLAIRRQFLHLAPSPQTSLVLELHKVLAPSADSGGQSTTVPVGWCSLPVFTPNGALRAGFWKLELSMPPLAVASDPSTRVAVPNVALYMRLALTADMERNRAFAVDPERTASIYTSPFEAERAAAAAVAAAAAAAVAAAGGVKEPFKVGESVFTLNPFFTDGTRLRMKPEDASDFTGQHVLNDVQVEILEMANSYARIRGPVDRHASLGEGWIRERNLSRHRRGQGLVTLEAPATPATPGAPTTAPDTGAPALDELATTAIAPAGEPPKAAPSEPPLPRPPPVQAPLPPFEDDKGVDVRPMRLVGWTPNDPKSIIESVRRGGGSGVRVHLSLVQRGARQPGGTYAPMGHPDALPGWQFSWYEGRTLRPNLDSEGVAEALLLVEVVAEVNVPSTPAQPNPSALSAPLASTVVGWATVPLFGSASAADGGGGGGGFLAGTEKTERILRLNAGLHTLSLSPPPVMLPNSERPGELAALPQRDAGERGELRGDLRGELTIRIATGKPPAPSADALLDMLGAKLDEVPGEMITSATRSARDNANVPPLAWLKSPEPSVPSDQLAYEGEGAVLVVDGARFLPDDVVASGVQATLLDERGMVLASARAPCMVLSDARMPRYPSLRLNLSDAALPANATLALTVLAVVQGVEEAVTLGFAPLALFTRLGDTSLTQPTSPRESAIALRTGAYQLPLYLGSSLAKASRGIAVSEASLSTGPRLPCATLLVRLLPGPRVSPSQIEGGSGHLDVVVIDERERVARLQQQPIPPAPAYATGAYDSTRSYPTKNELELYRLRLQRSPLQCLDAIGAEARDVGGVDEADAWLRRKLGDPNGAILISEAPPYNLRRFAPYSAAAGIQIGCRSAAGLAPPHAMCWAILSVHPPGSLYKTPREVQSDRFRITEAHDFSADLRAPIWPGRASHLPEVPLDPSALLIVDVRALEKPTVPSTLLSKGWSVMPIFTKVRHDGQVRVDSGVHVLPLFDGTPSAEVLATLGQVAVQPVLEWQRALGKLSQEKKLKAIDGASVTISLLDAQRYGEHEWADPQPPIEPSHARLPLGFEARYTAGAAKLSKPLGSIVGKVKQTVPPDAPKDFKPRVLSQQELELEANAAFRQAMGFPEPVQPRAPPPESEPEPVLRLQADVDGAGAVAGASYPGSASR